MIEEAPGNGLIISLICFGLGFLVAWAVLEAGVRKRELLRVRENNRIMRSFRSRGRR
jgi:hypothetical protein